MVLSATRWPASRFGWGSTRKTPMTTRMGLPSDRSVRSSVQSGGRALVEGVGYENGERAGQAVAEHMRLGASSNARKLLGDILGEHVNPRREGRIWFGARK